MEALVIEPTIAPVGTDYITRWSHRLALSRQPMLRAVLEHYFHDYSRHDSFSTFMSIWHLYVVRYQYQNFTTPFKPLENGSSMWSTSSKCSASISAWLRLWSIRSTLPQTPISEALADTRTSHRFADEKCAGVEV
jgi:hypothetical protein